MVHGADLWFFEPNDMVPHHGQNMVHATYLWRFVNHPWLNNFLGQVEPPKIL